MATVLHIEDDPRNRLLVKKLLLAAAHEVIEATGGLEAVRVAEQTRPDLVLVDLNIPDLDGYEVILRLRGMEHMREVPVVAITAEGEKQTTFAVGANGFMTKPINATRFADEVERYLQGHSESGDDTGVIRLRERSQIIVERLEKKVLELLAVNERLETEKRLRQEFLRNVSHELSTPMTPIVGYLRLLLNEELGPLSELQRKGLRAIEQSTQRLGTMVDNLLDVSALETGQFRISAERFDLSALARDVVEAVRTRPESTKLSWSVPNPWPETFITGDTARIRRAMEHILDNAVKFSAEGGQVAVATESAWRLADSLPAMAFVVADDGPGIAAAHRHRIVEPFYQVDGSTTRRFGGAGLGLAISRRVAESHGGALVIESPPERSVSGVAARGTLVALALPVVAASGGASANATSVETRH